MVTTSSRRILQHLAKIFQPFGHGVYLAFGGFFQSLGDGAIVHITAAGDFHARQTGEAGDMGKAAAIGANYRRRNAVIRADGLGWFPGLGSGVGQRPQTSVARLKPRPAVPVCLIKLRRLMESFILVG